MSGVDDCNKSNGGHDNGFIAAGSLTWETPSTTTTANQPEEEEEDQKKTLAMYSIV